MAVFFESLILELTVNDVDLTFNCALCKERLSEELCKMVEGVFKEFIRDLEGKDCSFWECPTGKITTARPQKLREAVLTGVLARSEEEHVLA